MPISLHLHSKKLTKVLVAGMCAITLGAPLASSITQPIAQAADAYDLSDYQGYLTSSQVRNLKHEVSFVILRAQAGSGYHDAQLDHNVKLMNRYHIPYGVYSYSYYVNPAQARGEADTLYHRAPNAKFYVNDIEKDFTDGTLNASTRAWSNEIHKHTNRPTVLYSGLYFMNTNITQYTRNKYNAIWLAAYGVEPNPPYHYDLWQFADNAYSRALGRSLDGDDFPEGSNKPLSFWIGNSSKRGPSKHKRSNIKPLNPATKQATNAAAQAALAKSKSKTRYYKNRANKLARKAQNESNLYTQLQNEYKNQGMALQNETKQMKDYQNQLSSTQDKLNKANRTINRLEGKHNSKAKKINTKAVKVDSKYYQNKHIHYVKVTNPGGINYYNASDSKKLGHIKKGAIVHVLNFRTKREGNHAITRALVDYGWNRNGSPRHCVITSNKNYVRRTTYNA